MSHLLKQFKLEDKFLGKYEKLVVEQVIPYQEKALNDQIPDAEKSHAIENFRLAAQKLSEGNCHEDFYGMVFQDSDVAKWLEAASYSLLNHPDGELEGRMDELVDLIEKAQHKDGYLNTYFTVKEPERRWTNLQEAHELYCAGHMMEAAVAYYEATGKDKLLHVMEAMAEHIYHHFILEKAEGYPGHPEVELALLRLYDATGNEKYKELAAHFIDVRGVDSEYFKREAKERGWTVWNMNAEDKEYAQNQSPVREQKKAVGHAVRAVYLYTAMADLAVKNDDHELMEACCTLWNNIVNQRMYITGGIGSTCIGEAFTKDYNLPNDTVYAETCASIGLMFFARRMMHINMDSQYADVMERALYNTVLAGMQLDGKRFFYVNPLEVIPGISGEAVTHKHDLPQRPKWFGCACCPPNVARVLTSIADYAWSETDSTVYSHLYVGGSLELGESKNAKLHVYTEYPYEGTVVYEVETKKEKTKFSLAIRIPSWCQRLSVKVNEKEVFARVSPNACDGKEDKTMIKEGYEDRLEVSNADGQRVKIEKGYVYIDKEFSDGDKVELSMDLSPYRVYSNPAVGANSGRTAIMRGPLVYCVEGADNDDDVLGLTFLKDSGIQVGKYDEKLLSGIVPLQIHGMRLQGTEALYTVKRPARVPTEIRAIPYYAWGNRGLNQMRVWVPEE